MARTKQATPLRRDPSSEYFSRDVTGTPSRSPGTWEKEKSNGEINGHVNGSAAKTPTPTTRKEAGALQFLVAVTGIYGSLYAPILLYGH
jgi:solute carrier family 35 (UDP-galactose transporter), member B1